MTESHPKGEQITALKVTDKAHYGLNHLDQCQVSGQSMAAYARSQGLGLKFFYRWRQQLRSLTAEAIIETTPLFHPVRISGSASSTGSPVKTLSMVLRLPNGIDCELKQIPIESLTEVLSAVAKLA
jgi:hypothetical protein